MALKMTIEEIHRFLADVFPAVCDVFEVLALSEDEITVRMKVSEKDIRPGGTVSGPTMFTLADVSYYLATLSHVGPKELTVTTSCSIDFMRKPAATDLIAKARVLKLGKVLSVGDVMLYSVGMEKPVAHANLTYSIPKDHV